MTDAIVVLNAGSSSFKFSLFAVSGPDLALVARGQAEGLYTSPRFVAKSDSGEVIEEKKWGDGVALGHEGALDHLVGFLRERSDGYKLAGVGHRVVHGGLEYSQPARMTEAVLKALEKYFPLALDNAINLESVAIKKIDSPVAGRANVLVVPDLEAGNMLAKSLSFLAGADAAGIVLGAKVPIILTSRADSVMARLASCAVAAMVAASRREKAGKAVG
jgi:hypothetical protein